jgi:hypothetical protein
MAAEPELVQCPHCLAHVPARAGWPCPSCGYEPGAANALRPLWRYRWLLAVLGVALLVGVVAAVTAPRTCVFGNDIANPTTNSYCSQYSGPDWAAGFWPAVVVYFLISGFILSARGLIAKE